MKNIFNLTIFISLSSCLFFSCSSTARIILLPTGITIIQKCRFELNTKFEEQETGPGLMFIEGGTFTMGRVEQVCHVQLIMFQF